MEISEKELKKKMGAERYRVLRERDTGAPGTGALLYNKEKGVYMCGVCKSKLFKSDEKFDSGSGWPSFWKAAREGSVKLKEDTSHGMKRTEVLCAKCGSHLGHIFDDVPKPTGKRYCINSLALDFEKK